MGSNAPHIRGKHGRSIARLNSSAPDFTAYKQETLKRVLSDKCLIESPTSQEAVAPKGAQTLRIEKAGNHEIKSLRRKVSMASKEQMGTRIASSRHHWQPIVLAFLVGVLTSYVFLLFSIRIGHPSLGLVIDFDQESPWGQSIETIGSDWPCRKPAKLGLSPRALTDMTGNPLATSDKLIVAARHSDDTSWLDIYLSDIPHVVYQVDNPEDSIGAQHITIANKGNEAMCYLQFIIDYYERLPATIVFLHGHRGTWHLKDHVPLLQRLRWGNLPFANLRYNNMPGDRLDWECGERTRLEEFRAFDCNWQGSHLHPRNGRLRKEKELNVGNKDVWWDSVELREVWPDVFQAEFGDVPEELHAPCCAEFMVVKERVLSHSKEFYIHLRDWIVETELGRYRSGRVFEYMWHVIFGEARVIEAVAECDLLYCDDDLNLSPEKSILKTDLDLGFRSPE